MISSAVVIPEHNQEQKSTPPSSLKRGQPSLSERGNKRPRLDDQNESVNGDVAEMRRELSSAAIAPTSPTNTRRSSARGAGLGVAEEKKRGRRLFGALLGTLAQPSSQATQKKREEIEARQRERLKKDNEEREEDRRRQRQGLDRRRRIEQKTWEEEGMRLRHRNLRAKAEFLKTKTEPRLYYRPWELRKVEEQQLQRQREEAEEQIEQEMAERATREARPSVVSSDDLDAQFSVTKVQEEDDRKAMKKELDVEPQTNHGYEGVEHKDKDGSQHRGTIEQSRGGQMDTETTNALTDRSGGGEKHKDDEHGHEELVEGQEDDVIY